MKSNTIWWSLFPMSLLLTWLPLVLGVTPLSLNGGRCNLIGMLILGICMGISAGKWCEYD